VEDNALNYQLTNAAMDSLIAILDSMNKRGFGANTGVFDQNSKSCSNNSKR